MEMRKDSSANKSYRKQLVFLSRILKIGSVYKFKVNFIALLVFFLIKESQLEPALKNCQNISKHTYC